MSVEARYPLGTVVFGQWQVRELIRTDPETNSVFFRLIHKDNPNIQGALKIITLIQEGTHPSQLSSDRQRELESRREISKNCAMQSIRQMHSLQGSPYFLGCQEYTFWDWQDASGSGCDLLMRTELLQDLRSILRGGHVFQEGEIRRIGSDLCAALEFCHTSQILHRCIRPENIFFDPNGQCKLGDFVAADLRRAFPAPGIPAPQYCAPEQFQGNHYRESDIYSLGLVLYEMSNGGYLPFTDTVQTFHEAINIRLQGYALPQPRQAGPALAAAIARACAYNPAERHHSAAELLSELSHTVPAPVPLKQSGNTAVPASQQPAKETQAQHHAATAKEKGKEKEKDDSKLILIIRTVVITALVLAVLGAGVFFYLRMQTVDPAPAGTEPAQIQNTQSPTQPSTQATTAPIETTAPTEPTQRTLPTNHYYYSCYNPHTEFVLSGSDVQYYSPAELRNLSDKELEVALAEIDARHGGMPSDPVLADYFSYLSWFIPSNTPYELSSLEQANAMLIRTLQKKRNGTLYASNNPYMPYFQANDYFMPEASTRYLTSRDLKDLSKSELNLALNEIFARHGYIFEADELMEYFYATNWYVPTYTREEFTYNYFSREEEANVGLVVVYQDLLDYTGPRSDNPYIRYLGYPEYILPNSSTIRLRESDLEGLDENQLLLAEEEIYARHGLAYQNVHLMHYFLECSWYTPEIAPGYSSRIQFSSVEQDNLALIKAYRKNH